jgi:hypothetical protein
MVPAARLLPVLLLVALGGCSEPGEPQTAAGNAAPPAAAPGGAAPDAGESRWSEFVERFTEDWMAAHPVYAVTAGRHEFDGQFPDWSAVGIRGEIERLRGLRREAEAFTDLTDEHAFEREYLLAVIDRNLFWMDEAEWPFRNLEFYFDWGSDYLSPDPYLSRPYAPLPERMAAYSNFARNLPRALAQIRANLRTPMPRTWVEKGIATFGGMAEFFADDVPGIFAQVDDAELQETFGKANGEAIAALAELTAWFESLRAAATEDYALGADLFAAMLRETEQVELPLDVLEDVGRQDLARNLVALDAACAEFAPGQDRAGCMAKMNANKPRGGAVAEARRQLGRLREFLVAESLVTIPGDDPILVEEAPPYARSNFAYINVPGPYDLGMPSVYNIAPPDPAWPEQEQYDYVPGVADLMSTSVHEVWPGHFLQFLHSNRVSIAVGRLFVGYAYAEGWAHYAEEMMWEAGLSGGLAGGLAEFRIGQVSKALYRNIRYLCAIGLHAKGMSAGECEAMFRERAFQDPGNARQQAARGTYDPGYLNYTLGKLMIRKLRDDWSATRGGRAAWGDFHDEFLSHGGPPVPMLRRLMLGPDAGPAL